MSPATTPDPSLDLDRADYDVIVVGGRPAGAALAIRLGGRGLRVLVLDKARFPSQPAVPSSPSLYAAALHELDELGVAEAQYAHATRCLSRFHFRFDELFEADLEVPEMWGRRGVYSVLRPEFDLALWRHLGRFPTVERREGFTVRALVRDANERVVGVRGQGEGGALEELRAQVVVGADGRYSPVAARAGARVVEAETECVSAVYFADWRGVALPGGDAAHVFTTGRGLDVISLPMPDGRVQVATHHRADRVRIEGDAEGYYRATLMGSPVIAGWLAQARMDSKVLGIKRVGNGYREAGGPGWLLVGDAVHYKDPADGQGIYDALLGARLLDAVLGPWLAQFRGSGVYDRQGFEGVVADYGRTLREATHPMYATTVRRLHRELYSEPPRLVANTLIRWLMNDPAYQRRFLAYLGREICAAGWLTPRLAVGAALRGVWRDLGGGG